jgi:hypothetical protein
MTHVLDIGTDLDDLLAAIGDLGLTLDADTAAGTPTAADVAARPPLVRPGAGLTTPAWYL